LPVNQGMSRSPLSIALPRANLRPALVDRRWIEDEAPVPWGISPFIRLN
jgi:hypothetical protein